MVPDREKISLISLEVITDALLEIMEACMKSVPDCDWLQTWTSLAKSFAFCHNPALQPRALIVFGCISKSVTDQDIKQLLRILVKALESFNDLVLLEALVMCLTRLQPLLRPESPIHKFLFWVGVSVLQLDQLSLYASGLALLEQNLHTLDSQGIFDEKPLETVMMATREPLEWHFKQLDHAVGLSFKANFHFALVGHLLKGFRHPTPTTVSRTARVLISLLGIVAKPSKRDKFEVTPESVAYLAALVAVSEEVRSRCHVKHIVSRTEAPFVNYLPQLIPNVNDIRENRHDMSFSGGHCHRQKSWDMDQSTSQAPRVVKQPATQTQSGPNGSTSAADGISGASTSKGWHSLDLGTQMPVIQTSRQLFRTKRSSSVPSPNSTDSNDSQKNRSTRVSVSNENNVLLDPEVLTDPTIQALVLTVLATLVKYTTDEAETRILYQYLAEASVVFAKVFPVIHSLLDAKLTSLLSTCHDQILLSSVQAIIQNMIACEDTSLQQLHFLQSCGFGGLWRFAGPFTKCNCTAESAEHFVNCLEAMVEMCMPMEEGEHDIAQYLKQDMLSVSSNMNLSSSLSSLTLGSPTDKEPFLESDGGTTGRSTFSKCRPSCKKMSNE
ncbi:hypothetical protein O3M35_003980 [Rhynocoris fuscipes]|uniref:Neurofibromin n=1 Tax=Rhynocoris fuscipes TaxID=488301 RepID=A0AAW1CK87_9HEMI